MKIIFAKNYSMKNNLNEEEIFILRNKGTEKAFSGKLLYNKKKGTYKCKGCNNKLLVTHQNTTQVQDGLAFGNQ